MMQQLERSLVAVLNVGGFHVAAKRWEGGGMGEGLSGDACSGATSQGLLAWECGHDAVESNERKVDRMAKIRISYI